MSQKPILIIDSLNLFARQYIRNPSMSTHGHQAGGIVGFMNSLAYLTSLTQPSAVYVIWEGGGSSRRRALFKDYKSNRRPPNLNRYYEDDIPDSKENRLKQIKFLVEVLCNVPVCQIFVDDCEADDVIGFLCRNTFNDKSKIIASSDRDFYQLLDDKTMIYSWSTKKFLGQNEVKAQFNISPANFVLAKALCGDPSDGIPGIKGVGFKTVAKRFDLMGEQLTIKEMLAVCATHKSPAIYKKIIDEANIVERNWRLMYLDTNNLAAMQINKINNVVKSYKSVKNKMKLMKCMIDEGLAAFDSHEFFSAFIAL